MNITGLDYLITFQCNSQCRHCSYQAGPTREGCISPDMARKWMVEICQIQSLKSITIHGGEPFLYYDEMKTILETASELDIAQKWVITNGFWADSYDITKDKLQVLKNAGLTAITFSVDAFHQEYVSFKKAMTGIKCAVELGFNTVAVDSYFLYSEEKNNEYNVKTTGFINSLKNLSGVRLNKFIASFEGRAAAMLVKQENTKKEIPNGRCHLPFWLGKSLLNPEIIEIDHEGNVTLCPGISIGNVANQPLTDIIEKYDPRKHPIINIIFEKGPIGLFELAKSNGYQGKKEFINECHLCYEMRKYLCPQYPQYLSPHTCYDND